MSDDDKIISENIRENLVDLLDLLSDKDKQIEYAKLVSDQTAITELVCMWFDDLYHPDNKIFVLAYSDKELEALKKFNAYYDTISDKIQNDSIEKLIADPNWVELIRLASETKAELTKK